MSVGSSVGRDVARSVGGWVGRGAARSRSAGSSARSLWERCSPRSAGRMGHAGSAAMRLRARSRCVRARRSASSAGISSRRFELRSSSVRRERRARGGNARSWLPGRRSSRRELS